LKVALVHDWLTGMRGGEKVLLELMRLLPGADLYTLLWNRGSVAPEIEARVRGTTFLQNLPRAASAYRYYLPLFPAAIRSLDLRGYDVILSSSHAVAKSVRVPEGAVHVSYVHTPMRYLWDTGADYFRFGRGRWWKRAALALVAPALRSFDRRTAAGVDFFIANSANVRERIRRVYGAEAQVIPPPVDTDFFTPSPASSSDQAEAYYLVVSSLEPYKRVDLAVEAFSGGKRRLLVAGSGTLEAELRARARPPVEFLGAVSGERLRNLYQHCRALIFPAREDFGIVAVEAQACGRPVVCYGQGGATESVLDGRTGVHFHEQSATALLEGVARLERSEWDAGAIRRHSLEFSQPQFHERMKSFLRAVVPGIWSFDECGSRNPAGHL
jgi:glycosyltransferase involved in cell wall biosynthesis